MIIPLRYISINLKESHPSVAADLVTLQSWKAIKKHLDNRIVTEMHALLYDLCCT